LNSFLAQSPGWLWSRKVKVKKWLPRVLKVYPLGFKGVKNLLVMVCKMFFLVSFGEYSLRGSLHSYGVL